MGGLMVHELYRDGGYPECHPPVMAGGLSTAARDVLLLVASGCDLGQELGDPRVCVQGWLAEGRQFRRPVPDAVLAELGGRGYVRRQPQHQLDWFEVTAAGRAWVDAHVLAEADPCPAT